MTSPRSLAMAVAGSLLFAAIIQAGDLETDFSHPPESTRPWCYWYWMTDNISREGITRDLESMARLGIGEALMGNVYLPETKPGDVKVLSEKWWGMVEHAIREGGRLGVNVGMFNCPGWSQSGGPWITPEHAMRYLVQSETRVKGPAKIEQKLPVPMEPFQDVAVLAFPVPQNDADSIAVHSPHVKCTPEVEGIEQLVDGKLETSVKLPKSFVLEIELPELFTARSLVLHLAHSPFRANCNLQAANADGSFHEVRSFPIHRQNKEINVGPMVYGPVAVAFESQNSKRFRLTFKTREGECALSEIELTGAARLESFVEKQLGRMCQVPQPMWDYYLWPRQVEPDAPECAVKPAAIQNLSDRLSPDGTLRWDVPEGDWIVQRIGMTPTGTQNAPASPEGQGLEVDKMNRSAARAHFNAYIGQLLKRMPAADRTAFHRVVADSYEMGPQNWTDGFADDFRKQYGYDPKPWLAVLTGRVVGSADQSDRFLWDLRRLVADRVARDYVGGLRESAQEHGLDLWLENYGHWGFPSEFLAYGGQSSLVGGEFWATGDLGSIECRAASSAANIYGKKQVFAESFTGGPQFASTPASLKARGDWSYCEGVNQVVLHVYIHQPWEEKWPGINAWFGTEFNRHNPWFEAAKPWIDYQRRCCFLLQQGWRAADVCYFIGEDAPKMTGVRHPELPSGYDFDYINGEVIRENLTVDKGSLTLPHGVAYRLLVLPELETMRPEVLRKVRDLVKAGATVYGPAPARSPSLQNYPACDEEVRSIAAELWGSLEPAKRGEHPFGAGKVVWGERLDTVLSDMGAPPDVTFHNTSRDAKFLFTHRRTPDTDIYFITNQKARPEKAECTFRITGKQPECWNAVTGTHRDAAIWRIQGGATVVPLPFAPTQSWFVVFRRDAAPPETPVDREPTRTVAMELPGPWKVYFDLKWSGPGEVTFDKLEDWTRRPEDGVRHYSGKATYRMKMDRPSSAGGRLFLNLGEVKGLAAVRLNGKDVGTLWTDPWRVEITSAVQPTDNQLEIDVITPWVNRLIGDAGLPAAQQTTMITVHMFGKDVPLKRSGLLGPVVVEEER